VKKNHLSVLICLFFLAITIFPVKSVFAFTITILKGELVSAQGFSSSLSGKILLQVQAKGEAWYVNPNDNKRYYLGRPNDAFALMRALGVGITNDNLNKIQIGDGNLAGAVDADGDGLSDALEDSLGTDKNKADTDGDSYNDKTEILNGYDPFGAGRLSLDNEFARIQKGKIFLQVQKNGEAWYVNPNDNKRYFLGWPQDAFNLMQKFGLGVTNGDLDKIPLSQTADLAPALPEKASLGQPSSPQNSSSQPSAAQIFSSQESSGQDSSVDPELRYCGSLDCLIGAAASCEISEASYSLTIPFPLVARERMQTIVHSIIMGKNPDGSCTLTQQTQGSVVSVSEQDKGIMMSFGLTSEQIDSQIKSANETLNANAVLKAVLACTGTAENIAAYLTTSQTGFKSLDCLLQGGEKERSCAIEPNLNCVMRMP
jgi:hypothetical protein